MTIVTRKATGLPTWPVTLLAGMQGAGKSYLAAKASASPLVARTYWVGYGERDPDELGAIPGADFDIVDHDGTVKGVVAVLNEIADMPVPDAGPALIVFDSGSVFWSTIVENVNAAKTARGPRDDDNDLWDAGKRDWQAMLGALRRHKGPSIITARFEEASVVVGGKITDEKAWKIRGEKGLPYDVGAVIEMRERGEYIIRKVQSEIMTFTGPIVAPDFTMDELWRELGLADLEPGYATFATPVPDSAASADKSARNWMVELEQANSADRIAKLGIAANKANADTDVLKAIRRKHATLTPVTP